MKLLILLLLALPLSVICQERNVVHYNRFFIKPGKGLDFEKALTDHVSKYHTSKSKWKVYKIMSGPDAGGYQVVEGPFSWDDIDAQGNLDQIHQQHWNNTISGMLADRTQSGFSVYRADLSTIALEDYSNKIAISHIFPKPGYTLDMEELIKKLKKSWESGGNTVAVYEASSSGPQQYIFVTRYKQGLKERNKGFRKPFKDLYNQSNGENSFDDYIKSVRMYLDHTWNELLSFQPDLSSNK